MNRCMFRRLLVHLARLRYSRGFGIQSPTAYAFFRDVVFEKLPYYAYEPLSRLSDPRLGEGECRLLFRIVNYASPAVAIDVFPSSMTPVSYMAAVSSRIKAVALTAGHLPAGSMTDVAAGGELGFCIDDGNVAERLSALCAGERVVAHINRIDDTGLMAEAVTAIVRHFGPGSIVLVEGINSRKVKDIWRNACRVVEGGVAFDLYDMGILISEPGMESHYYKLNY